MKILLSNDDGYQATGLEVLHQIVSQFAEVVVMAPQENRSGVSNALTLRQPLRVMRDDRGFGYVNGTPADCVHLALNGVLDFEPDMVVSGINHGANLGDDVIYSGTVAAAMEGQFLGRPGVAVSLAAGNAETNHFDTVRAVLGDLMKRLIAEPLSQDTILNVNVPNVPLDELRGVEPARLGSRHQSQPIIPLGSDGGGRIYQIGPPGDEADAGPGTDFYAISQNKVSITPLSTDMTRHHGLGQLSHWLKDG